MLSLNAQCTCCYSTATETVFAVCLYYFSFKVYTFASALSSGYCAGIETNTDISCVLKFVLCHLYDQHITVLFQNATPYLNYQPYDFTAFVVCFLTVPQSSKCIQISKMHLQIIKKYAWLGLLIPSKYRSWFSHNKAIILHFLAIVWAITWATTAVSQGFAGRGEFSGFCGEPGDCGSCCGFYSSVEPMCLAAAAEKGRPTPLD